MKDTYIRRSSEKKGMTFGTALLWGTIGVVVTVGTVLTYFNWSYYVVPTYQWIRYSGSSYIAAAGNFMHPKVAKAKVAPTPIGVAKSDETEFSKLRKQVAELSLQLVTKDKELAAAKAEIASLNRTLTPAPTVVVATATPQASVAPLPAETPTPAPTQSEVAQSSPSVVPHITPIPTIPPELLKPAASSPTATPQPPSVSTQDAERLASRKKGKSTTLSADDLRRKIAELEAKCPRPDRRN